MESLNTLATRVSVALTTRNFTLVTAESCTGGWVAKVLTDIAGSSSWFERGLVTYSNRAKQELLGVAAATLAQHGAVSEAVAREMASGALRQGGADVALAVTGIAGPGGGTADKPVGTVWFAWATNGGVRSLQQCFGGDREAVRRAAVQQALQGVLDGLD